MSARKSKKSPPNPPTEVDPALKAQISQISQAIVRKPPYCQGTIPLSADDFTLFYGKDFNAHRLNLANASPENLQHLAGTCDPATFGLGQEDVYDETYRKAGKLDAPDFMLGFTPDALGLLDVVRAELLVEGRNSAKSIRAELYKLNVYGPDAFFKAHVDTPRSELMFGSLVIVFPTTHEGGALLLRERVAEQIQEWTFDSAALLAQETQPSIAYVAFYSDVEHEVMPVLSGHRVTVTYNLYYVQEDGADGAALVQLAHPVPTNEGSFRETLKRLLADPTFLPKGGNLLFPLRHQYPLSTAPKREHEARKALQDVAARLKMSDALVLRIMRELGLDTSLRVVYEERTPYFGVQYIMCDRIPKLDGIELEDDLSDYLRRMAGGVLLNPDLKRQPWYANASDGVAQVHWISSGPWQVNSVKTTFMAHGNQAELAHTYWKLSLLVRVGPAGARGVVEAGASSGK